MMLLDVVRAAIPGANEDDADYILWSRTSYPMGSVDAKTIHKAASRLERARVNGFELCDLCDDKASDNGLCDKHLLALYNLKQ